MLNQIFTAATNLPVVIQGALGSGLFALLLYIGQKIFTFTANRIAKSSRSRRKVYLIEQQVKYNVTKSKDFSARGAYVSLLTYRASRALFKALIWLSLGLAFGTLYKNLSIVGYCGCIYFLFKGLNTVSAPESVDDVDAKLKEIKTELEALNDA